MVVPAKFTWQAPVVGGPNLVGHIVASAPPPRGMAAAAASLQIFDEYLDGSCSVRSDDEQRAPEAQGAAQGQGTRRAHTRQACAAQGRGRRRQAQAGTGRRRAQAGAGRRRQAQAGASRCRQAQGAGRCRQAQAVAGRRTQVPQGRDRAGAGDKARRTQTGQVQGRCRAGARASAKPQPSVCTRSASVRGGVQVQRSAESAPPELDLTQKSAKSR